MKKFKACEEGGPRTRAKKAVELFASEYYTEEVKNEVDRLTAAAAPRDEKEQLIAEDKKAYTNR